MNRTTKSRSTNFAALAMLAALIYYFGGSVLGMVMQQQQQHLYFWGTTDEQRDFIRERVFRTVCSDWKEKTWFERNVPYRDRKWCDDYATRL